MVILHNSIKELLVKEVIMKVSERIRGLREDKGLNQTEVAKMLNTSQTVYSRYERNERDLPIDYLYTLCVFYNVTADYILGFTNDPKPLPKK